MNKLISHPFELELNSWFAELQERLLTSALSGEGWLRNSLRALQGRKHAVLEQFRAGGHPHNEYRALCSEAEELLHEVEVQEGPTDFVWLNRPLRAVNRFLSGEKCDSELAAHLKSALLQLEPEQQLLRREVTQLLLWSEGHRDLCGLELKACCEKIVVLAQTTLTQSEQPLDFGTLLRLVQSEEGDFYEDVFLAALEEWELEFSRFEVLVESIAPEAVTELDSVADAWENLQQALEENICEAESALQELRNEWTRVSSSLYPLINLRLKKQDVSALPAHLQRLTDLVRGFQEGRNSLAQLRAELQAHSSRWNEAHPQLRSHWMGQPARLSALATVSASLEALRTVESPGDARLGPLLSVYCGSLDGLLKEGGEAAA